MSETQAVIAHLEKKARRDCEGEGMTHYYGCPCSVLKVIRELEDENSKLKKRARRVRAESKEQQFAIEKTHSVLQNGPCYVGDYFRNPNDWDRIKKVLGYDD